MKIGNRVFEDANHTYVWGILNVTPDSFSDGGKWNQLDRALFHVEAMMKQGMDVLDVGGESTRPGYTLLLPVEEEIARVVPVIEAIKSRLDVPISLDTYKSGVAEAGILAGADLINDIWGLKYDENMGNVIAKFQVPCCLMHNRKTSDYQNFLQDVKADLEETMKLAAEAGIQKESIILDPGVGFGKNYEQNLQIIHHMDSLHELGCPVLLGCSRKSVIGLTLDLPVDQREEGTVATTVLAVMKGISHVRVHNVEANVRAIRMTEAILRG